MKDICEEYGITQILNAPYSSQQNGIAKRAIRTITEMAAALRYHSGLPKQFWGYAVKYAVYILNHLPRIKKTTLYDDNNNIIKTKSIPRLSRIEEYEKFKAKNTKDL